MVSAPMASTPDPTSALPDYAVVCRALCRLAVPTLADMAIIEVEDEHGIERVAEYHADPVELDL